jgi:hypothetical protein
VKSKEKGVTRSIDVKNLSNSQHVSKAANLAEPTIIVVQNSLPQVVTLLSAAVTVIVGAFTVTTTYLAYRQNVSKQATTAVRPTIKPASFNSEEQQKLHGMLDNYFDDLELQDLCFDMGIDYEDLPASGQSHKARELVELCSRRGRLPQLHQMIKGRRPHLFAEDLPTYQINQSQQATAVA